MNKPIFILLLGHLMVCRGAVTAEFNVPTDETSRVIYDPRAKSEMDSLASAEDVAKFAGTLAVDWTLFVEDRSHSIRKTTGLPKRWLDNLPGHTQNFAGTAQPGEFYVFQVGVFAAKAATGPIAVRYENLPGIRCFNLGGTNFLGQTFIKSVGVEKGKLQALWFGLDVPKTATAAIQGQIIIAAAGVSQTINVKLAVTGAVLDDHGDRDSWRLSRLRWLDSTLGLNDNVVTQPFVPIVRKVPTRSCLRRRWTDSGRTGSGLAIGSRRNTAQSHWRPDVARHDERADNRARHPNVQPGLNGCRDLGVSRSTLTS